MTSIANTAPLDLLDSLLAPGRAPEISEEDDVYGWLVGSWELDVLYYWNDVGDQNIKGEVQCARALEGRAVQDVWIMPKRSERNGSPNSVCNTYGTTIRVWDGALRAWRVTWINPVTGQVDRLIGRWQGRDIVQIGTHADGTPIRWNFSEITPDSFLWTGEGLAPDGKTWTLQGKFRARRTR